MMWSQSKDLADDYQTLLNNSQIITITFSGFEHTCAAPTILLFTPFVLADAVFLTCHLNKYDIYQNTRVDALHTGLRFI